MRGRGGQECKCIGFAIIRSQVQYYSTNWRQEILPVIREKGTETFH